MIGGMGYGIMGLGGLAFTVFLVILVVGGVWLALTLSPSAPRLAAPAPAPTQTPLDVLKMRYAKGEIDKEQYEQMKRDLES